MPDLKFLFPTDGDFVNSRDGVWKDGALYVEVRLQANCKYPTVCGLEATFREDLGCHTVCIPLFGYRNSVVAKAGEEECRITVFVMPEENLKKFRVSSDDNIRFLQELTEGDYASIFDHPYLAVYKKAHDLYGATAHLNLFYAFDDIAREKFSGTHRYFDLSMMTDRYKEEFRENAHWLKLAFHAKSEYPERPYRYADRETVRRDCIAVYREICRFAGKECISNSTTIHFGEGNREVVRALRSLGFTSLTGYFERDEHNQPLVSYYADLATVDHVGARDFWMDTSEDMIFGRIDRVLNLGTLPEVLAAVQNAMEDPHRGGFVSIMIHEQYFYPDYAMYLPDFADRVLLPCKMLAEQGYTGALISQVTEEPSLAENSHFGSV